jgi:SAM-dependent methyltransferase
MIGAQLASASKGTPQDVPAQATVSYFMEGRLSDLQSLARTLSNPQEGYSVVVTPLPGVMGQCDRASEVVCTAPTVKQALNLLESVAVIMALKDDGFYFPMKNQDRERYLRMFGDLKAPYFLYHMFLLLGNIDPGSFTQLQGKGLIPAGLKMGNSQVQRHAAISEKLTGGPLLYDLGCGEGYHALRLAKVYDGVVAVDRDVGLLTRRTAGQADLNVTIKEEELTPTWPTEQGEALAGVHVLLSEVLEHMERADAVTFLRNLLEQKPEKVVVTLPNGEFNKYFPLEEGQTFRHWDHKWEPSFDQVGVFEGEVLPGNWLGMVTIAPGGDTVDGVSLFTIMTFSSDTQEA